MLGTGYANLFISNLTRSSVIDEERCIARSFRSKKRRVLEEELGYGNIIGDIRKKNWRREKGHWILQQTQLHMYIYVDPHYCKGTR